MTTYNCHHFVLFGDLDQRRVQSAFDELMAVHYLQNFVDFPTHRSGSSLDPVKSVPLGYVGTSDHEAVFPKVRLRTPKEETTTRTMWNWENANWTEFRFCLL